MCSQGDTQNFIEAVKKNSQESLNTPIRSGSVAAINAHMGNIAFKTGNKIYWDTKAGRFNNNTAANNMITPEYHNGWKLPVV